MSARDPFYVHAQTLRFSGSENRLQSGRRPEPQAGAEKLLRGRNYLRRDITGMRGEFQKRSEGLDN